MSPIFYTVEVVFGIYVPLLNIELGGIHLHVKHKVILVL